MNLVYPLFAKHKDDFTLQEPGWQPPYFLKHSEKYSSCTLNKVQCLYWKCVLNDSMFYYTVKENDDVRRRCLVLIISHDMSTCHPLFTKEKKVITFSLVPRLLTYYKFKGKQRVIWLDSWMMYFLLLQYKSRYIKTNWLSFTFFGQVSQGHTTFFFVFSPIDRLRKIMINLVRLNKWALANGQCSTLYNYW